MIMRGWKGGPRSSGLLGGPILEGGLRPPHTPWEHISQKKQKEYKKHESKAKKENIWYIRTFFVIFWEWLSIFRWVKNKLLYHNSFVDFGIFGWLKVYCMNFLIKFTFSDAFHV